MEHWYQGYTRPGARVYSDFVGCIRSGDLLEAVILDTARDAAAESRAQCHQLPRRDQRL